MDKEIKHLINRTLYIYVAVTVILVLASYNVSDFVAITSIITCAVVSVVTFYQKKTVLNLMNRHTNQKVSAVDTAAKSSFKTFPVGIIIIDKNNGKIKWFNEEFLSYFSKENDIFEMEIFSVIEELSFDKIKNHYSHFPCEMEIGENIYKIYSAVDVDSKDLITLYFTEITEDVKIRNAFERTKPVISIISIDNYDELLRNTTDAENSLILAGINTRLNEWTKEYNGIFRKFDRDKYLFIFANSHIKEFCDKKFPILTSIHEIQTAEGITATLSIGIGLDGETLEDNYEFALNSLDMALSRGGDQAVIKNKYSFEFYGGMSKEVEKRTKVKSRVIANALNQIIKDSEEVYVMGHKISDFDCVGAAIGMCAAIRSNDKPHKIVIDKETSSAKSLLKRLDKNETYKDIFITPEEALIKMTPETLLIVVDTNSPTQVESEQILESALKVVVIDHHRRAADYIENPTVNMHEPYASSTCEIVAELLQYMLSTSKVTKTESEALLSGILLDTKHFASKTGARTFEAAAFLKRIGADIDSVQLLFKNDFDSYVSKQQITSNVKIYQNKYAISVTSTDVERSIASQCADELLGIQDIQASFVIFKGENATNISARSNSKVNVQVLMEKLGGGGSLNAAACKFDSDTTENIERILKETLDEYDMLDEQKQ